MVSVEGTVGAAGIAECALSPLPRIDYADRFTMSPGVEASPEEWARAMFGDVPDAGEVFIWQVLLHLRLHRGRSPGTVAGWRIAARGDDWIRLEARSWFLAPNLIVRVADGRVSLVTLLHYRRAVGRLVWPPCAAVHRRLVPQVFADAVARRTRPRGRPLLSRDDNGGTGS
jgi:hypothetical protein